MSQPIPFNRLIIIDFLRGFAALMVMFYHLGDKGIFGKQTQFQPPPLLENLFVYPLSFGFTGVYLFFLISGFCIHLRWVKAAVADNGDKPLAFAAFWKRRFRRIYPAYIAAMLLFILAQWYLGNFEFNRFFIWDFTSHIFMIHNLDSRTVYSLNGVFWTLAIEEQLYLAYFLLVRWRKRFGWMITLAIVFFARIVAFALSYIVLKLFLFDLPILESALANWGIWALGAVCVEAKFGLIKLPKWCYSPAIGMILFVFTAYLYIISRTVESMSRADKFFMIILQPLWGISFFFLFNYFLKFEDKLKGNAKKIILMIAGIGLFSYSLYLTHDLVFLILKDIPKIVQGIICLIFAWAFYLIFEKPFMNLWENKKPSKLNFSRKEITAENRI